MTQNRQDLLAISLGCPISIEAGTDVELCGSLLVQPLSSIGSPLAVGRVRTHHLNKTHCVVETRFAHRRHDRVAGAMLAIGPFVLGEGGTAWPYIPAAPAKVAGNLAGPVAITTGTNDVITLSIDAATAVTVTLAPGTAVTMAQIAAAINTALGSQPAFAYVDPSGFLHMRGTLVGGSIAIETVTGVGNPYSAIGWTAGTYSGRLASDDRLCVAGLVLTPATAAGQTVETLEY